MTTLVAQSPNWITRVGRHLSRICVGLLAIQSIVRFIPNVFESFVLGSANSCVDIQKRDKEQHRDATFTHTFSFPRSENHPSHESCLIAPPSCSPYHYVCRKNSRGALASSAAHYFKRRNTHETVNRILQSGPN